MINAKIEKKKLDDVRMVNQFADVFLDDCKVHFWWIIDRVYLDLSRISFGNEITTPADNLDSFSLD